MRVKVSDFAKRYAFIIGHPGAQSLEIFEDIESHLEACKSMLLWLGFQDNETEIKVIPDEGDNDTVERDLSKILKEACVNE